MKKILLLLTLTCVFYIINAQTQNDTVFLKTLSGISEKSKLDSIIRTGEIHIDSVLIFKDSTRQSTAADTSTIKEWIKKSVPMNDIRFGDLMGFYGLDGSQNLLFDYDDFIEEKGRDGSTGNDYFRYINSWMNKTGVVDTLNLTFSVGTGHTTGQLFKCAKYIKKKSGTDSIFTNLVRIIDISPDNFSSGYSYFGGDTIYGTKRIGSGSFDSILRFDLNFNRIAPAVYFDESLFGINVINNNKMWQDDSGYFYYPCYDRPGPLEYQGLILRSTIPNDINNWVTVDTVKYQDSLIRPEELVILKGKSNQLHCVIRSDWGPRIWIKTSYDGGVTWDSLRVAGTGGNLPKALITEDSTLIVLPSRDIAYFSSKAEIKHFPINRLVENVQPKDASYFNTFILSWDNFKTFYQDNIDARKVGNFTAKTESFMESADVVEIGKDTLRIFYGQGNRDYVGIGSIYYKDIILEKEGFWRVIGGSYPIENIRYRTDLRTNKVSFIDSSSEAITAFVADSNEINIQSEKVDRYSMDKPLHLGVNKPNTFETGVFEGALNVTGKGASYYRYGSGWFENVLSAGGTRDNPTDFPLLGVQTDNGGRSFLFYRNGEYRRHGRYNFNGYRYEGNNIVSDFNVLIDTGSGLLEGLRLDTSLAFNVYGGLKIQNSKNLILNGGNVGIGVTDPIYPLDIWSTSSTRFSVFGQGRGLIFANNSGAQIGTIKRSDNFISSSMHYNSLAAHIWKSKNPSGSVNVADMILDLDGNLGVATTIPSQKLHIGGNALVDSAVYDGSTVTVTSSTYDVKTGDRYIFADATAGNITINLPPASLSAKRILTIKLISSSNSVTADGNGSETIDGATTQSISTQYSFFTIKCNGTTWYIVGN